jgi:hypothetical protein
MLNITGEKTMNNLTQEQVSELSGEDLNIGLATLLGLEHIGKSVFSKDEIRVKKPMEPSFRVDYCNNWIDLMPVLKENHKDFILMGYRIDQGLQCKSPQRTLAEWLFLVLQEKAKL